MVVGDSSFVPSEAALRTGEDSLELKVLRMSRDCGARARAGVFPKEHLSVSHKISPSFIPAPIEKVGTGLNQKLKLVKNMWILAFVRFIVYLRNNSLGHERFRLSP